MLIYLLVILLMLLNIMFNILYIKYIGQGKLFNYHNYKCEFTLLPWYIKIPKYLYYWLVVIYYEHYLPFLIRAVFGLFLGVAILQLPWLLELRGYFMEVYCVIVVISAIPFSYAGVNLHDMVVFACKKRKKVKQVKQNEQDKLS